ncbi:Chitin synthase, class 2, partial [Nowakowskiella sp. JEL0078]
MSSGYSNREGNGRHYDDDRHNRSKDEYYNGKAQYSNAPGRDWRDESPLPVQNAPRGPMPQTTFAAPQDPYGSQAQYNSPGPNMMPLPNQGYLGPAPARGLPYKKTIRQIQLTPQGNLVIDIPVPDRVLQGGRFQKGEEFTHLRYTAATCDADQFPTKGYTLRQQETGRATELFVVVTMYNEDDFLFTKTMHALSKNIAHLCTRSKSKTWGGEGWKKITVCIVSDGRTKINQRVLSVLGIMGVYQDGIMKESVNGKDVAAHIFEYTTQVCLDTEGNIKGPADGIVPMQVLFCLKEKNAKKINSHRWFFNAFGALLRPNVCVLIDVGTKPSGTSLYHLWKAFDRSPSIGGACGEIYAETGAGCINMLNPLVAAQNFEYKISNILDKPLESVFGFISVLPGAFSAYRYAALQGHPLTQYFKGETMHGGSDIFSANMYLAEDRILCFELVTKQNQSWLLHYVKAAKAETDVPDNVAEFISQRRRWLNGSFFAGVHALSHWYFVFRSGHSIFRKLLLLLLFFYNLIQTFFSWFGLGNFYLTFYFLLSGRVPDIDNKTLDEVNNDPFGYRPDTENPGFYKGNGKDVFFFLQGAYMVTMILIIISAFGNRPQGSKFLYTMAMILFATIMAVMLYVSGYTIYLTIPKSVKEWLNVKSLLDNHTFRDMVISTASTYGMYFLSSFMYFEPWHMFTSFIQYLFLMPAFVNILQVYAFANLHDVSWGTKGDNGGGEGLGAVTAVKNKDGQIQVEFEIPTDKNDINNNYEKFLKDLKSPRPAEKKKRDAKTKQEDYFKSFRTKVVLSWFVSNLALIALFSSQTALTVWSTFLHVDLTSTFNPYLTASASVIGIDYGTDWFKVSIVKSGVPLDIVLNSESKRKSNSIVTIRDGIRHFGNDAVNLAPRFPLLTFSALKNLLGKEHSDKVVSEYIDSFSNLLLKDEDRGTVAFNVNQTIYSVEELVAMQLAHAKRQAELSGNEKIHGAVITVPPYFNQFERQAMIDAAELAGLKVLGLINDETA